MYRKNATGQYLYFAVVNATTGAAITGATVTGKRSIDGAAQGSVTGTISEDAGGQYHLALSAADCNGSNIGFLFTATSAIPVSLSILTDGNPPDVNLKNAAGTPVTLDANNVLNVSAKYWAGTAITATSIPVATAAGAAGGLFIAGSNAATTISGLTTGALSCTTITASGAVAFQSTFAVTTSTSLAALSCTTLTASGAVAFQGTFIVTGATTLTGAVTASNGANSISGVTVATNNDKTGYSLSQAFPTNFSALLISVGGHISNVDTLTTYTGDTPQTGDAYNVVKSGGAGDAAAIKAKTDSLTFTVAGFLDSNVQYVNDVQVKGTGTGGDPWNPV